MKTFFKFLSIAVVMLVFSCKQEQSEDSKTFDKQMKETIQIHDDVMPKMSEINSMISKLESEKENLLKAEEVNSEKVEMHEDAIASLKDAHDLMMSWMKNFSDSFSRTEINQGLETTDKDSIKAKLTQLDAQYNSAEEMKKAIVEAIENAQLILSK
jgi:hypothetical protein